MCSNHNDNTGLLQYAKEECFGQILLQHSVRLLYGFLYWVQNGILHFEEPDRILPHALFSSVSLCSFLMQSWHFAFLRTRSPLQAHNFLQTLRSLANSDFFWSCSNIKFFKTIETSAESWYRIFSRNSDMQKYYWIKLHLAGFSLRQYCIRLYCPMVVDHLLFLDNGIDEMVVDGF